VIPLSNHGYLIIIEQAPANYGAWAPDLPGCVATGATVEECEAEMRDAISFHLEGMRIAGEAIPQPAAVATSVVDIAV